MSAEHPEPGEEKLDANAVEFRPPRRRAPRHGGSILMAAMLGLAEALGWDPEPTEVVQPADLPSGPDFDLSYGRLPPLN